MVTVDEILVVSLAGTTLQPAEVARVHAALATLQEWPTPGTASLVAVDGQGSAVVVGVPDRPFMVVVVSPPSASAHGFVSETLTKREREVAELAAARLDNATIARVLRIAPDTVQSHMKEIHRKQGRGNWQRSKVRADDVAPPVQRFTHAERDLLSKLAVSPLVGAVARHAGISPRRCRARLDSIARKAEGPEGGQPVRRRTPRTNR